jgi:Bacterial SH3 domain
MIIKKATLLSTVTVSLLFMAACGAFKSAPSVTATPSPSATHDPCSSKNLPAAITPMNNLMRQFDDYATLAAHTPQSQLVQVIPPLQAILRAAEDQGVPSCLQDIKGYQLQYMNAFIQTLLAFESNAKPDVINAERAQANQYQNQYAIGLAHLLGLTVVVASTATADAQAPKPSATLAAAQTVTFTVINRGSNPLNVHVSPSLTSQTIGTLPVGQSVTALGKTATGEWIEIEAPGQPGKTYWVYTTLVKFSSGNLASLPVVTPTP